MIRTFSLMISTLALTLLPGSAIARDQIIRVGNLLTDAASLPSGPATIIVRDGKIAEIRRGSDPVTGADAELIDLSSKTVMPGLIDLHVHLTGDPGGDFWKATTEPSEWGVVVGAKNALITAKAGFTTVREAGSSQYSAFSLRRGTAEGIIPGPRIIAAGPALAIVGGRDQDYRHRRRPVATGSRTRRAIYQRRNAVDCRHGPFAGPEGHGSRPWRTRYRGRITRRYRYD